MPGRRLSVAPGGNTEYEEKMKERMQRLEKLMPWDHKMDTVDMLVEAQKYAKYLQARLKALQEMPSHSSSPASSSGLTSDAGAVESETSLFLKKPTRNQVLQFLVGSPEAQKILYTTQTCVVSEEQLLESPDQQKWSGWRFLVFPLSFFFVLCFMFFFFPLFCLILKFNGLSYFYYL